MSELTVSNDRVQEIKESLERSRQEYAERDHAGYVPFEFFYLDELLTGIEERSARIDRHQKLVRKLFGEAIQPTFILGPSIANEVEWALNHD